MSSFYSVLTNQSRDIQDSTLHHDIETHLTALLNARQYMLSTHLDYGLPDVCTEITQGYFAKLTDALRELIKRFEPRLTVKQVICENDKMPHDQLRIKVIASVLNSSLIELQAKLGPQTHNTVKVV